MTCVLALIFHVQCFRSVQPFLSPDEFKVTEALVEEFQKEGGTGRKLQSYLEDRAKKHENWVTWPKNQELLVSIMNTSQIPR